MTRSSGGYMNWVSLCVLYTISQRIMSNGYWGINLSMETHISFRRSWHKTIKSGRSKILGNWFIIQLCQTSTKLYSNGAAITYATHSQCQHQKQIDRAWRATRHNCDWLSLEYHLSTFTRINHDILNEYDKRRINIISVYNEERTLFVCSPHSHANWWSGASHNKCTLHMEYEFLPTVHCCWKGWK